jgi:hypothetical protein
MTQWICGANQQRKKRKITIAKLYHQRRWFSWWALIPIPRSIHLCWKGRVYLASGDLFLKDNLMVDCVIFCFSLHRDWELLNTTSLTGVEKFFTAIYTRRCEKWPSYKTRCSFDLNIYEEILLSHQSFFFVLLLVAFLVTCSIRLSLSVFF